MSQSHLEESSKYKISAENDMKSESATKNIAIDSSQFEDKVNSIRDSVDSLNEEASSHSEKEKWSAERKLYYLQAIENLQKEVNEMEIEWNNLYSHIHKQSEKLESLLTSFPDTLDISTLKILSIRLSHLEKLVSDHINEERGKNSEKSSKIQLIISASMLSVTVILWGIWLSLQFF
ncbi:MAG: hypothetical protein K9J81_01875 [Desulfohalobiaceae bacterium]|nr:hypothetical protein [Desulfohalobiaceae bacterium]